MKLDMFLDDGWGVNKYFECTSKERPFRQGSFVKRWFSDKFS